MREIKLDVGSFTKIFLEALKEVPPLRDYGYCPSCGRTSIKWDPSQKKHRCPWDDCEWIEPTRSLPLRSISGRRLTTGELLKMIRENLERR